ncbi:MAG TPA: hypothetical protein IGS53_04775 [Leptolyngbyaceae cyanobacterium M33_DOE_097]|uniref:Replication-related protein n=1 Tax=Oscillatoriales cyanobacterium SpSt-418 TaxID=2282169 RepID=A0A7C3KF96_9CYAN|nr:hypothetical protein [Leptolyngbyaceae cyanobacterium M33_DOE_097]
MNPPPSLSQLGSTPHYIPERDSFLELFPHRFDYIYADHPSPGAKVEWRTENRHPLSDRLIQQGAYLYGVRFGHETQYCVIDIDAGSPYHPTRDRHAINRIRATLESLGFVSSILCTSSYSGGLHLYFPFSEPQESWELALVLDTLLSNAGFKPTLGQLEIFPNVREYITDGKPHLFAAHRLPMQAGSYLLDDEFQPLRSSQEMFVWQWQYAQRRNTIHKPTLKQTLKVARRRHYSLTGKADKFLNDLNADIEPGWSSHGQTNFILGRIALRAYVFGHILNSCEPLEGKALVDEIVRVATQLPGYADWCRHQHEIEHRAEEWAMCVQTSRYFHFGKEINTTTGNTVTPTDGRLRQNQKRSQAARDKIQQAISQLLEQNALPTQATARFKALLAYNIGGSSLYRHKDLWHPEFLTHEPVENPPHPPELNQPVQDAKSTCTEPTSLLQGNARNSNINGVSSDPNSTQNTPDARNDLSNWTWIDPGMEPAKAIAVIKAQLAAQREARKQAQQQKPEIQQQRHQVKVIERMRSYLQSGDPILMAEAIAWAEVNPGILDIANP